LEWLGEMSWLSSIGVPVGRFFCRHCQRNDTHVTKLCPKYAESICSVCSRKGHNGDNCPKVSCSFCEEKKRRGAIGHSIQVCKFLVGYTCGLCRGLGHRAVDCEHLCLQCVNTTAVEQYRLRQDEKLDDDDILWDLTDSLHLESKCPTCTFCRRKGHLAATCSRKKKAICSLCCETGHTSPQCYNFCPSSCRATQEPTLSPEEKWCHPECHDHVSEGSLKGPTATPHRPERHRRTNCKLRYTIVGIHVQNANTRTCDSCQTTNTAYFIKDRICLKDPLDLCESCCNALQTRLQTKLTFGD